jgi:hypothetical protein
LAASFVPGRKAATARLRSTVTPIGTTASLPLYRSDEVAQDTTGHIEAAPRRALYFDKRISSLTDENLGICLERIIILGWTTCYDCGSRIDVYAASEGSSA